MTDTAVLLDDEWFEASTPTLRGDAEVRLYGHEAVALSPLDARAVHLDPVGATLVQLLDGSSTIREIVADVSDIVGIPAAVARGQLWRVVSLFDQASLLTTSQHGATDGGIRDADVFPAPPNP